VRRLKAIVAGLGVLAGSALLALPAAAAPGAGTYAPTVSSRTVTVTGHGWGHGHGLSQYGSEGAARHGSSAAQILSFYYPGTATTVVANTAIRALITERTGHLLFASGRVGLQVRDGNGVLSTLDPSVAFWRLAYAGGYLLQRLSGTSWLTVRTSATPLGFVQSTSVREWAASGTTTDFSQLTSRDYRGELRLVWDGGTTTTVNVVPMDSYLRGVVPRESPSSWPAAALQAQAVAARSYSAYKRAFSTGRSFDVYDTTADQVYGGAASYTSAASSPVPLEAASTDAAIAATAGQVRTYNGTPIFAQFSSSNGGFSADGGQPYLRAAPDPYEAYSDNPYQNWTATVAVSSLQALSGLATVTGLVMHRQTSSGGHVSTVDLIGADSAGRLATVTRTGDELRSYFGWRSTYFSVSSLLPTPSDFDGDGRSDAAVFRPSTGQWWMRGLAPVVYGVTGDVPLSADFTGDGRTDVAVFRPSSGVWYVHGLPAVAFGRTGDVPVAADFTGDGRADITVFRSGFWYVRGAAAVPFGRADDVPVAADFNGDGRADITVFRSGVWYVRGAAALPYGQPGDVPVARDFTGDGRADIAVFRPSTGVWYVRGLPAVAYGQAGDVPVARDVDGDGRAEVSVFRPATSTWSARGFASVVWGRPGDIAIHP